MDKILFTLIVEDFTSQPAKTKESPKKSYKVGCLFQISF